MPTTDTTPASAPADDADALPPLYGLTELPRRPWMPRRNGKPVSLATVYRWLTNGVRGSAPLRTVMVGGRRCTCDEWARQFFQAVTDGPTPSVASRTPSARARAQRRAEAALEAAGI